MMLMMAVIMLLIMLTMMIMLLTLVLETMNMPMLLFLLPIVATWQVVVEHAGDFPTPPAMPPKEVEVAGSDSCLWFQYAFRELPFPSSRTYPMRPRGSL